MLCKASSSIQQLGRSSASVVPSPTSIKERTCRVVAKRILVVARGSDSAGSKPAGDPAPEPEAVPQKSIGQRIREFFVGDPNEKNKLAAIGMAAFLSYGFVSNVTYGFCLSFSWHAFMKAKGTCPLDPGQWPSFLAFYAGIWAVQNVVRPARFALAVAMAPAFDRGINFVGKSLRVDKKAAFGFLLFCMALTMTTCLFSSIYFFGGMPNGFGPFPPLPAK